MRSLSRRCFAFSLALLGLASWSALGRSGTLADYEITSSEGGQSSGTLTVDADGSVVRRVTCADTSVHTYTGKGQLSGATLTVRFDGSGEPRDLTGEWDLQGENENGAYRGTATFGLKKGQWVAAVRGNYYDDDEALGAVEIRGRFAQSGAPGGSSLSLVGQRRGPGVGDAAPLRSAVYTLSPDGLALVASFSTMREAFTRSRLPATGGPTATYSFEEGGRLTGTVANGAKDQGTKVASKTASDSRAKVEPDPFPSSLRAVRATSILKAADRSSAVARTVRANELVPVCGREGGFWVVGPFEEAGQRRGWKGYVVEGDLDNRLHYADVPGPIFLKDKPPSVTSVVQRDLGTCYLDAALMAIAHVQSRSIAAMIRDHGDGTVSVRFFRRAGGRFEEQWVRIQRTIIVDERGRSHYTVGEGGQLWPALVEKAFAAWRGQGWYRNIEGGSAGEVFELILGMQARSRGWVVPLPTELGERRGFGRRGRGGGGDVPSLGADDTRALGVYRDSEAGKKEALALLNKPAARRDIAYVASHLEVLAKAGLSEEGRKSLHAFYAANFDGPLGSGKYGPQAMELYKQIRATLDARLPVAMSTRSWGTTPGTGQSGRENMQVVAGLASEHEYVVTGAYEDADHLLWIKVVNPWQHFARRYDREGGRLVARAASRREGEGGAFAVELSDVMRYYASVAYVTGR